MPSTLDLLSDVQENDSAHTLYIVTSKSMSNFSAMHHKTFPSLSSKVLLAAAKLSTRVGMSSLFPLVHQGNHLSLSC